MARKARFLDNPGVSAFGVTNAATATSASFATTAISASFATTASHALFAVSASHEIVKEVSSSHANTADVAGGLQGQPSIYVTNITASGNVSSSATSTASFGTYLGDGSQLSGISTTPFPFTGEAQITGSLLLDSGSFTYQPNSGSSAAALGSFKIKGYDLTDTGERFFDVFTMDHVVEAEESTLVRPRILFKSALPQNSGGITTVFFGTGSEDRSAPSVNIHGEFAYSNATNNNFSVSGSLGSIIFSSIIPLSTTTSTLGQSINRWNAIYAKTGSFSGNVSGSATSTASFGTYLGDGSQLSNISTTPFPFSGSAVITGSLTITGSQTDATTAVEKVDLGKYHIKTKNSLDLGG